MHRGQKTVLFVVFLAFVLIPNIIPSIEGLQGSQSVLSYGTIRYSFSWLHTSGIFIYNEANVKVDLYTINFHYGGGQGLTLGDIENAKALGFNAFRLHVYWGLIQPYNETLDGIDESIFSSAKAPLYHGLDAVVNWAVQQNMYFIVNLYWSSSWGPPSWAFPGVADETQRFSALISGVASRERTGIVNVWKYIANRYKNVPNVIFEFLNEPTVSDETLAGDSYRVFNEEIISAVESVETNSHLKIVELVCAGTAYVEALDTAVDINKPNVLWATHRYTPMYDWDLNADYYHGSFTWHGQYFPEGWGNGTLYVAWRIIRCAERIHGWNKPWIDTEFSRNVTQTYWKEWFEVVLETKATYNVTGWALWCYCSDTEAERGWNIKDPTTQQMIMSQISSYMVQT